MNNKGGLAELAVHGGIPHPKSKSNYEEDRNTSVFLNRLCTGGIVWKIGQVDIPYCYFENNWPQLLRAYFNVLCLTLSFHIFPPVIHYGLPCFEISMINVQQIQHRFDLSLKKINSSWCIKTMYKLSIHLSIFCTNYSSQGTWSLPQETQGTRLGTPWTKCQTIRIQSHTHSHTTDNLTMPISLQCMVFRL